MLDTVEIEREGRKIILRLNKYLEVECMSFDSAPVNGMKPNPDLEFCDKYADDINKAYAEAVFNYMHFGEE